MSDDVTVTATEEVTENTPVPPKTLEDFRASFREAAKKATSTADETKVDDKVEVNADDPKDTASEATKDGSEQTATATDADKKEPGSPDEKHDGKVTDALSALGKRERALAKRESKLKDREKELEDKATAYGGLDPLKSARDRLTAATDKFTKATTDEERIAARKERTAALVALVGSEVSIDDLSELSAAIGSDAKPLTIEEAKRLAREEAKAELKAELEAEKKRQEDARKQAEQATVQKETNWIKNTAAPWLDENADKFPVFQVDPVRQEEIVKLMREGYRAKGELPTAEEIFTFLHEQRVNDIKAKAKAAGLVSDKKEETPVSKPPIKTITAADKRGAPPASDAPSGKKRTSYDEDRQAFRARVKAQLQASK